MSFGNSIEWKLKFVSGVEDVYQALNTDSGRSSFWSESAVEADGCITFSILNYPDCKAKILERIPNEKLCLDYFGTEVTFDISPTDGEGCVLTLTAHVEDLELRDEMRSGWVSVLLAMKAYVDFGVDLRNHDSEYSWQNGYVDN